MLKAIDKVLNRELEVVDIEEDSGLNNVIEAGEINIGELVETGKIKQFRINIFDYPTATLTMVNAEGETFNIILNNSFSENYDLTISNFGVLTIKGKNVQVSEGNYYWSADFSYDSETCIVRTSIGAPIRVYYD